LPNDPYPQTPRIADQRDQIGNIIVAQTSNSEPRGFDDHLGRFGRNGCAPIGGVLRGLTRSGVNVTARTKVIEVDPRGDPAGVFGLGERPRRIAEGVLKALAKARVAEPA